MSSLPYYFSPSCWCCPSYDNKELRRDVVYVLMLLVIAFLVGIEIINFQSSNSFFTGHYCNRIQEIQGSSGAAVVNTLRSNSSTLHTLSIAIGIFSVMRPGAPDYIYAEVMSILDTLFVNQSLLHIDKVHIFDGSRNGSQVRFFKYSKHVEIHPMDLVSYNAVKNLAVHRKASMNYLNALKYLTKRYDQQVDGYLILEDDVIFDPDSAAIIHKALCYAKANPLFLIDGYVRGQRHSTAQESEDIPLQQFTGDSRCCSQSFLLSPQVAKISIPLIEQSLNGSALYEPLDVYLTRSLLKIPDFYFYFAKHCWVQHVGYPHLNLGIFHRGGSRMDFDRN